MKERKYKSFVAQLQIQDSFHINKDVTLQRIRRKNKNCEEKNNNEANQCVQ